MVRGSHATGLAIAARNTGRRSATERRAPGELTVGNIARIVWQTCRSESHGGEGSKSVKAEETRGFLVEASGRTPGRRAGATRLRVGPAGRTPPLSGLSLVGSRGTNR